MAFKIKRFIPASPLTMPDPKDPKDPKKVEKPTRVINSLRKRVET